MGFGQIHTSFNDSPASCL